MLQNRKLQSHGRVISEENYDSRKVSSCSTWLHWSALNKLLYWSDLFIGVRLSRLHLYLQPLNIMWAKTVTQRRVRMCSGRCMNRHVTSTVFVGGCVKHTETDLGINHSVWWRNYIKGLLLEYIAERWKGNAWTAWEVTDKFTGGCPDDCAVQATSALITGKPTFMLDVKAWTWNVQPACPCTDQWSDPDDFAWYCWEAGIVRLWVSMGWRTPLSLAQPAASETV